VAREKPDGYTLFLAEVGPNAVSHTLGARLPYDPHTAFTPIIHAANLPAVVLIRPTLPYKTLAEFVAAAKQQPGKFTYASAGTFAAKGRIKDKDGGFTIYTTRSP